MWRYFSLPTRRYTPSVFSVVVFLSAGLSAKLDNHRLGRPAEVNRFTVQGARPPPAQQGMATAAAVQALAA